MLSQTTVWKNHVYAVCERSGDIHPGELFQGVELAERHPFYPIPRGEAVVCCGRLNRDDPLFHSQDGRIYFSLCGGWGKERGFLYGLSVGLYFDFGHPTSHDTILDDCRASLGNHNTYGAAMAYQHRKPILDAIAAVMGGAQD